jgi:single-strand DNA-binding protein
MANDLNQCNFIGRLGADPESRFMPTGDAVSNFRIAVGWKTKDKEGAEWVPVVVFGKLAEICNQYLVKGSQVFISGRFRTREWEKDGVKRYSTEIIADQMQMLGGKGADSGERQQSAPRQQRQTPARTQSAPSGGGLDEMDPDIPF